MAKFQLTISSAYVPSWGLAEGLREAVQNALDGAQAGYPMEIEPPTSSDPVLRIRNRGITLDRSIWLMGTTSKSSGDYRGCYGEGLKLGALALTRLGRNVTFSNGAEDWRVKLEPSPAFSGQPVVTVYTVKRRRPTDSFTISITCLPHEWEAARDNFLDLLSDPPEAYTAPTGDQIIMDSAFAGKLFVKGIHVETKENMAYGYNFLGASVDRDRRMVQSFDVNWYISAAWSRAVMDSDASGITADTMLDLLLSKSEDFDAFKMRQPDARAMQIVESAWVERYGKDVIPVGSLQEANAAGHIGLQGLVTTEAVCAFLAGSDTLNLERASRTRSTKPTRTWRLNELVPHELLNLQTAVELVEEAIRLGPATDYVRSLVGRVEVVDFSSPNTLGQHQGGTVPARILISRRALDDFPKALEVLVHETAHDAGGDGDARHQRTEGALYSFIALHALQGRHLCPENLSIRATTASDSLPLHRRNPTHDRDLLANLPQGDCLGVAPDLQFLAPAEF